MKYYLIVHITLFNHYHFKHKTFLINVMYEQFYCIV